MFSAAERGEATINDLYNMLKHFSNNTEISR